MVILQPYQYVIDMNFREVQFFFPEYNIRLYDKNSESDFPLEVKWSVPKLIKIFYIWALSKVWFTLYNDLIILNNNGIFADKTTVQNSCQ
jgi:hypothetical protein